MKITLYILFILGLTFIFCLLVQESKQKCEIIYGKVISSHFIQPTFRTNWTATSGRVQLENGQITTFYSRPDNIYEVGDIIRSSNGCGEINQEIGRDHD